MILKVLLVIGSDWVRKVLPDKFIIQPMAVLGGDERKEDLSRGSGSLGACLCRMCLVPALLDFFFLFSGCHKVISSPIPIKPADQGLSLKITK